MCFRGVPRGAVPAKGEQARERAREGAGKRGDKCGDVENQRGKTGNKKNGFTSEKGGEKIFFIFLFDILK